MSQLRVLFCFQAACQGNEDVAKYLLSHGASPNVRDNFQNQPIDEARKNNHEGIILLLEAYEEEEKKKENEEKKEEEEEKEIENFCVTLN